MGSPTKEHSLADTTVTYAANTSLDSSLPMVPDTIPVRGSCRMDIGTRVWGGVYGTYIHPLSALFKPVGEHPLVEVGQEVE